MISFKHLCQLFLMIQIAGLQDQQGMDLFLLHPRFHQSPHLQRSQYAQQKDFKFKVCKEKLVKKYAYTVIEFLFTKYVLLQS